MSSAPQRVDVVVIGAGVSGLTTAIRLAEGGSTVEVWTDQPLLATTSAAAGAMWGPYLTEPRDLIAAWSLESLTEFVQLAEQPDTGVAMVSGIEAGRIPADPPDWADMVPDFALCSASQLPPGFVSGWRFTAPIIDMHLYLPYLQQRFLSAGGVLKTCKAIQLADGFDHAPVVVNCTGFGARAIAKDETVTAVRGDLITVANPGIDAFFSEETGPSEDLLHIYPQRSHLILGGTAVVTDNPIREPDPAVARAILRRCAAIEPRLENAEIVDHRVGLRPTRPQVRLSAEYDRGRLIIHNYGHGGSGVTLSWGCASRVQAIAEAGG